MTFSLKDIEVEINGNQLLKDISLTIKKGEIFCLIGSSGAGKSTLLRTLNRLQPISKGEILMDGTSIYSMSPQEVRKNAVMILQTPSLFEGTVQENILYGVKLKENKIEDPKKMVSNALHQVGLEANLLYRNTGSLSIGQQQRVSIARAICTKPKILLGDEITSALDPQATIQIQELLLTLKNEEKMTIILVTHNMDLVKQIADRVGLLMDGELVEICDKDEFFKCPNTELGKHFLSTIA